MAMVKVNIPLELDFAALREQDRTLLNVINGPATSPEQAMHLEELLELINTIQYKAAEEGVSADIVYGTQGV